MVNNIDDIAVHRSERKKDKRALLMEYGEIPYTPYEFRLSEIQKVTPPRAYDTSRSTQINQIKNLFDATLNAQINQIRNSFDEPV